MKLLLNCLINTRNFFCVSIYTYIYIYVYSYIYVHLHIYKNKNIQENLTVVVSERWGIRVVFGFVFLAGFSKVSKMNMLYFRIRKMELHL